MKKTVCHLLSAAFLLALPAATLAETSINATTIFRLYQDDRPGFEKKQLAPLTQFLGIDSDKLADGNLSVHLYGWGRLDLGDKSFDNNRADGELTHGYLKYRFKQANAQARAGRFFVHEGIVNEQVDGVSVRTDLPLGFGISAFGGATVHSADLPGESTDGKGDGIAGGRLSYRHGGMLELGISGVYETDAATLRNPRNIALVNGARLGDHQLIGGDIWFSPVRMVELQGHTSYNTDTSSIAEHSYLLNVKPVKDLVLSLEYDEVSERDYFFSSAIFASLLETLNDKSRSTGARVSYGVAQGMELAADYRHYSRDIGSADRMGGDLRVTRMKNTLRSGVSYHYLRAGSEFAVIPSSTDSSSFHELRAYTMHDTKSYFAALDAIGYLFKERINNEKNAWEVMTSLGYHLTPSLALSGDVSYGKNPQYTDDLKGLVRLTYNMTYTGKGDAK